jgi:hypothetical protein
MTVEKMFKSIRDVERGTTTVTAGVSCTVETKPVRDVGGWFSGDEKTADSDEMALAMRARSP